MRVLVTGLSGQDGGYLATALGARGDVVVGIPGDLSQPGAGAFVREQRPDLVVNLAAVSSVARSWDDPLLTAQVNGLLVAELLDACRSVGSAFVQASSAEMFGAPATAPQNESTPIAPTSPYGASKAYAHGLVGAYRTAGLAASSVILYNHESPQRPEAFVTRKITLGAARIAAGLQDSLTLGNLDARRDWGWAPDYVDALLRSAAAPGDYVIATGVSHSVADFVAAAFARVGIDDWRSHVRVDPALLRSGDAPDLRGDASKARRELGWAPTLGFEQIVQAMVDADVRRVAAGEA